MNNFFDISKLSYHYPGSQKPFIRNINLSLPEHALVSLIGANGSGKSTLIKLCSALLKPTAGSITLQQQVLHTSKAQWRANKLALLAPHWELKPTLTVCELLTLFTPYTKVNLHDCHYLTILNLPPLLDRTFTSLSSGEQARVLLARTLMLPAKLVLLDEPFANIDLEQENNLWRLLQVESKQRLIIITSHQLVLAAHYSQQLIILREGKLHAYGTPKQIFTQQNLNDAWQSNRYQLQHFNDKPAHLWLNDH